MELTIDAEFKALLPALTPDEYNALQSSIMEEGCRDPIITWGSVIIDGMNRYEICTALGCGFRTKVLDFPDRDSVKAWMIQNQFGRRNLNASQRAILAAQLASLSRGGDRQSAKMRFETSIDKAAETMNVSPRSVDQAKMVLAEGDKDLQKAVRDGQMSVSAAAKSISEASKPKQILAKDEEGNELPQLIAAGYDRHRERIVTWQRECTRLKSEILAAFELEKKMFPSFDVAQFTASIDYCFNILKPAKPHCVCPACKGVSTKCSNCNGNGWVSQYQLRTAPLGR